MYRRVQVIITLESVFCLRHWILQNFASLSQESGDWMRPTALGPGKKIAFPWAGSWALTSLMMFSMELTLSRTEMGEIMIVWCSGGGENRECFWVIHYSVAWQAVKSCPTNDRKAEPLWLMLLPSPDWLLHQGNTETVLLDIFRRKLCCIDCTHVQTNIHCSSAAMFVLLSAGYDILSVKSKTRC